MYICFIRESHKPLTYWLIFFIIIINFFYCLTIIPHHTSLFISFVPSFVFVIIFFFVVLPSFFIILIYIYPLFYPLILSSHFFLCHEWWSFTFQCIEDGHVPFHSYLMDIGSEILSWEGHLVRESSCISLLESISIPLCILRGVHLLIFRVWGGKKKN